LAQARHRPGLRPLGALVAAALGAACASGGGDLAARFPALRSIGGQRLADAHPYVLPREGEVVLFLCRWSASAPIPVSLPPDASAEERGALEAALHAWEGAGLGVRFTEVGAERAAIRIALEEGPVRTGAGLDTGNTVADCRLAPLSQQGGVAVRAELVGAAIRLARHTNPDWQDHARALTPAELAGSALHELGHALGFEGHARQGDTVMVREVEVVQHAGRDLLAGEPFSDATLRALYALPSGAVVSRAPVGAARTEEVDRMARLAEREGLDGPYARVGESAARLWWRDGAGNEYGFLVPKLPALVRDPQTLALLPESRTRDALARAGGS